jgi:NAD(P)-dependent dehydrogenase (short-subunit alcohol dehydrogenase family)
MTPNFGAYGPSKAGVIAITQTAAVENAKAGIRVNVICPGPTDGTNLMADSVSAGAQDVERLTSQVIPLGKLGTTTDVADAVVFLCSNLSGHITGSVLPVCGGMQM